MGSVSRRIFFRQNVSRVALVLLASAAVLMSGCGSFFSCEGKASCPATGTGGTGTGTGGSSSVDYAYVANSSKGSTYVNGYNLGSGTLTAVTDSPISLSYAPVSMVVTPANTYLYTASDPALSTGNIYGYALGTGGVLSILGGGSPLISENDAALAVSPDGNWLFTLPTDALQINEYPITTTTGILGQLAGFYGLSSAPTGTITPLSITVAPSGQYFAAALGTGGANVYAFNTTTGIGATTPVTINPGSASAGIYAVAFDSNNNLYCVGTAGLQVFSVSTGGAVTLLKTYPVGGGPRSIAINSTSTYVYVGNESDSTISGFSIGTDGALTAITGSPFAAPNSVNALAFDSTSAYLIASGYDSTSGIQLFTVGTTGALTQKGTAATGTSSTIPGVIAATH